MRSLFVAGSFFVFMLLWTRRANLILYVLLFLTGHWDRFAEPGAWKLSAQVLCLFIVAPARPALGQTCTDLSELAHGDGVAPCQPPPLDVCVLHRTLIKSVYFLLDHTNIIEFFLCFFIKGGRDHMGHFSTWAAVATIILSLPC